jgi:hypothetical protein
MDNTARAAAGERRDVNPHALRIRYLMDALVVHIFSAALAVGAWRTVGNCS